MYHHQVKIHRQSDFSAYLFLPLRSFLFLCALIETVTKMTPMLPKALEGSGFLHGDPLFPSIHLPVAWYLRHLTMSRRPGPIYQILSWTPAFETAFSVLSPRDKASFAVHTG